MKFFIGIDSGGTKTAVSVIDEDKNEVLSFQKELVIIYKLVLMD
ncbi:hypothetical protein [Cetobacterium somerae]